MANKNKFIEKENWNGCIAVYCNDKFIGQYSKLCRNFSQISGNENQIFSKDLATEYLETKTNEKLKIEVRSTGTGQQILNIRY